MSAMSRAPRPRARQVGIRLGRMTTGPLNAITDVAGVMVGHATLVRGEGALVPGQGPVRTGVTAVVPHSGDLFAEKLPAAAVVFNGYGKTVGLVQVEELGELETPILLTNTLNVGKVADALVAYAVERHPAIGISTGSINPVVAECNDGSLNDIQGRHVGESEVRAALAAASGNAVVEGNVGAGAGMTAYGFAGGIGTASRLIASDAGGYTVGALVLANFGRRADLLIGGTPVGAALSAATVAPDRGSVIVILATDAPADARQLRRIAQRAAFGLARTGTYCGHGSGDLAIAFSTTNRVPHYATAPSRTVEVLNESARAIDDLFAATVEAVEESVINALCAARPVVGRDGNRRDALPIEETLAILRRHQLAGQDGPDGRTAGDLEHD